MRPEQAGERGGLDWRDLVRKSFLSPRAAAREVLALTPNPGVLVQAAIAVTAAGMVLAYAAMRLGDDGELDSVTAALLDAPLVGAAVQLAVIAAVSWLAWQVGRLFGGTGSLGGAFALVIWLNVMMAILQVLQLGALLVLPPLAAVLALASVFWVLWAFASFVAELHEFENSGFVLAGVLLTMLVLFLGVGMVLALLGVTPGESM